MWTGEQYNTNSQAINLRIQYHYEMIFVTVAWTTSYAVLLDSYWFTSVYYLIVVGNSFFDDILVLYKYITQIPFGENLPILMGVVKKKR